MPRSWVAVLTTRSTRPTSLKARSPGRFTQGGKTYLTRAPKTTANHVTAWWDASQLYGYDERSGQRVKHDPERRGQIVADAGQRGAGAGDKLGYLPVFEPSDPINPEWSGQEATAFPDNWSIGTSFYHNVFARNTTFLSMNSGSRPLARPIATVA